MNKFGLLLSALLLAGTSSISAQMDASIKLNEVMTSNSASLQDEYGQHPAWLEIENISHSTYNIRGMYITTDRSVLDRKMSVPERQKHMSQIPNGDERTNLSGRQHLVLYLGSQPNLGALQKVEKFKREDPHGFGMALMAMGIVFFCLALLWIVFSLFGMLMRHMETAKKVANKQPIKPITKTVEKTIEVGHKTGVILKDGFESKGIDREVYMAVIGMALKQYEDDVHDVESGIITIKSKATDWDDEYAQMTHFHEPVLPTTHQAPRIPTGPELK